MVSKLIMIGIILVVLIGFIIVINIFFKTKKKIIFAEEYRDKFISFANNYNSSYERYNRSGNIDNELYIWLTKNVSKIQSNVGSFGVLSYQPAFKNYMINNYQIIINTLPKFRDGLIENFDITSVDDSLLRYIGHTEEVLIQQKKNLVNPIVWFREGISEILSFPIIMLHWFGIITSYKVKSLKESFIYKLFSGFVALVALISGVVTIIVGYQQSSNIIKSLFK